MHSTFAALSRFWPAIATSGMIRCRAYRWTSEALSATVDARWPIKSGIIMGEGSTGLEDWRWNIVA